jgi:alpha-N-arabinofuranosidase
MKTLALTILTTLLLAPLAALHAATYTVAPNGNDSNTGTEAQPFRTIQKAADVLQPGDTCMIRGGEYREKIVPPRGGSSEEARITYRAYRDEKPVIKGSERVTGWTDEGGGVWKAVLPAKFFASSPYNPFATKLAGLWITNPGKQWSLGAVHLDGAPLSGRQSLAEVQSTTKTWWAMQDGENTVIHARFDTDPNKAVAEVNVRDSCFHPGEKVLNFISIVDLTMRQAAPQGSGPIHPQQGIITAYAGKGWVIEGCTISDSACSGIALATGPESWYSPQSATQNAKGTAPDFNASGFHVVRHNTIERCGQAGIIGMINGHSSIIEGNLIQDINVERNVGGAETAGIKLHWAIDTVIRHNIIRRVLCGKEAGQGFGVWLDFACQGARVSGNVIYDISDPSKASPKCFPLYLEANVGPMVVDNNILLKHPLGPFNNELGSLHQVTAHNLVLEGRLQHFNDPSRNVPYYQPHSLKFIAKLDAAAASDKANWRYIDRNNLYIGPFSDQDGATETAGNVRFDATAQQALKFTRADTPDGVTIEFQLSDEAHAKLTGGDPITSASHGEFPLVKQRLEDRDGKPYDLDTDIIGKVREAKAGAVVPGPFAKLEKGMNSFRFTAGSSASVFVSTNNSERK